MTHHGLTIKTARESKGITQTELAERMNMPQPSLSRTEGGDPRRNPTIATLEKAAEALGITLVRLLRYAS